MVPSRRGVTRRLRECNECFIDTFFGYETQKLVAVNSWKIGLMYRLIQISILVYISVWVMYYERGYQAFDNAVSGVMIKVKGIVFSNRSKLRELGEQLWDAADYKVPPQQNSGVFITTNVVITPNQTQDRCPESISVEHSNCTVDADCQEGYIDTYGHGIYTGHCSKEALRCEVYAWCPTEVDQTITDDIPFRDIVNMTLLIKNSIEFPEFKVKRRNILPWMTSKYLKNCHYNSENERDKYCPIFKLGELFRYTNTDVEKLLFYGGSVAISIDWTCDLDHSEEYCLPKYTFSRLDDINHQSSGQGWNFHHAYEYKNDGRTYRTLIKAYGVQFFVLVTGRGGRFNVLNFTMNCGSGLALLGAATLCCDLFVLHFMKSKKRYREAKFDLFHISNHTNIPNNATMRSSRKSRFSSAKLPKLNNTNTTTSTPNNRTNECTLSTVEGRSLPQMSQRISTPLPPLPPLPPPIPLQVRHSSPEEEDAGPWEMASTALVNTRDHPNRRSWDNRTTSNATSSKLASKRSTSSSGPFARASRFFRGKDRHERDGGAERLEMNKTRSRRLSSSCDDHIIIKETTVT